MNNTLHFCWLIDPWKKSREKYVRAWQAAGWQCVLWHNGQLETDPGIEGLQFRHVEEILTGSPIEKVFRYELEHRSHASCADLLRFWLIYSLGGAYSDIDILPVDAKPGLEGLLFGDTPHRPLEIRFIYSEPGHELLKLIMNAAVYNESKYMRTGGYAIQLRDVISRTGPKVAERIAKTYVQGRNETLDKYILRNAVFEETEENNKEHHDLRFPEMIRCAKMVPGVVPRMVWPSKTAKRG